MFKKFKNTCKKKKGKNNDIVIFMAAYEVNEFKKKCVFLKNTSNRKSLFEMYHIAGISCDGTYITPENKVTYSSEFNHLDLSSSVRFDFENEETKDAFDEKTLGEMIYTVSFEQRAHALLDESTMKITTCFNMESFLVIIAEKVYQVDPVAFILNTSIVIAFELIHFDTGETLNGSEIYGRWNNLSIRPVEKVKYFNQESFVDLDNVKRISDIIYDNIWGFFETAGNNRWVASQYSYLHNILVFSNSIKNAEEYFQKVLGAQIEDFSLKDIATNNQYKYYAKEYLGLVVDSTDESKNEILIDIQILEAFKMYLYLQLIIDYDINNELIKLLDHQIFVKSLLYPRHVPIITMNVIDNLKRTVTFIERAQAIELKIDALKLLQQRKRNSNGIFLNVLLFVLALIGSVQSLQVLSQELGISFCGGLIVIGVGFTILLLVWIFREKKLK